MLAIVRWLKEAPRVNHLGYFFLQDAPMHRGCSVYNIDSSGSYYQLTLDAYAITKEIDSNKGSVAKKNAVAQPDLKSKQNALHYIFSNELCNESDNKLDTILRDSDAVSQCVQYKNSEYSVHLGYGRHGGECHCGRECPACEELYQSLNRMLKQSKDDYHELKRKEILSSTKKLIEANKPLITEALLKPFENDDLGLMNQLLLAHDIKGNTPLFYCYTTNNNGASVVKLLHRIKDLTIQHKQQLLKEHNENGQTIVHAMMSWDDIALEIQYFGADLMKQAMSLSDYNGNTPLHIVLCKSHPLSMIQNICNLFSEAHAPKELEEKHIDVPVDTVFGKNNKGLNPLHLLCQRDSSKADENLHILDELLKVMSNELCEKKLIEQDDNGCTPLHYAIKSGNGALVRRILSLQDVQTKKMAEIEDKHLETLLHYACRFGNQETLKMIIENIGPCKFYEIRSQSNLIKLMHKNNNISEADFQTEINKHNKLFACFDYFVKNYSKTSENYKHRMDDFCECLASMVREFKPNQPFSLPDSLFNFNMKGHFFGLFKSRNRYQHLRRNLQNVECCELEEFKAFLKEHSNNHENTSSKVAKRLLDKIDHIPILSKPHRGEVKEIKASSSPRLLAAPLSPNAADKPPSYEEATKKVIS